MSSSANRRVFDRVPTRNKIMVRGKGRLAMVAFAVNLSVGGILLNATPALPMGSDCKIVLFDGADHRIQLAGTVVRSDDGGTAIRFSEQLAAEHLQALVTHGSADISLADSFRAYLQVGRNASNAGCEQLLGVSPKTFKRVFTSTFSACIPAAVLPVWYLRGAVQAFPAWEKILVCFIYGGVWYLALQPAMDVAILHLLRKRKA